MEKYISSFLLLHVISGGIALVVAPIALIVRKGSREHKLWGKIYFYAMLLVAITAILISLIKGYDFLFFIAIFSFYMSLSGYRWISRKRIKGLRDVSLLDKLITALGFVFNFSFLIYTLYDYSKSGSLNIVTLVFSLLGTYLVVLDFRLFRNPKPEQKSWFFAHYGMMLGSYISAVTAFVVVNLDFLPNMVAWLGPTVLGLPVIVYLNVRYRKQLLGK